MSILAWSLTLATLPPFPVPTVSVPPNVQDDPITESPITENPIHAVEPAPSADEADPESSTSWWQSLLAVPGDLSLLLDRFHGFVSDQLVRRTDQIDQFFGDERLLDDDRVALVRLRQELIGAESGDLLTRTRVSARVPFPRIERGLRMVIETSSDDEELAGDPLLVAGADPERVAGVEYAVPVSQEIRTSLNVGGKFDDGFKARGELKFQTSYGTEEWRVRVLEGIRWRDGEGFAERTRLDLDHLAGTRGIARSRTEAEWGERTQGVEFQQTFSVARALDAKTGISGAIGVAAHTRPSWIVDGYVAEVRLRRQFHRPWIFLELIPRANFPRERRYEFTPELVFAVAIRFGGVLPQEEEVGGSSKKHEVP